MSPDVSGRFAGEDVFFSVDVEADGPIPLVHSLQSLGSCVAGTSDGKRFNRLDPEVCTFYAELQPISTEFDPAALAVAGLDRDRLAREGEAPADAMQRFVDWVHASAGAGRPVFTAYPAAFDWPWVSIYLARFTEGRSPFGFSGVLDMKTMYAVKAGVRIGKAAKSSMPAGLLSTRPHTHHALDDALEQADLLANLFEWQGG